MSTIKIESKEIKRTKLEINGVNAEIITYEPTKDGDIFKIITTNRNHGVDIEYMLLNQMYPGYIRTKQALLTINFNGIDVACDQLIINNGLEEKSMFFDISYFFTVEKANKREQQSKRIGIIANIVGETNLRLDKCNLCLFIKTPVDGVVLDYLSNSIYFGKEEILYRLNYGAPLFDTSFYKPSEIFLKVANYLRDNKVKAFIYLTNWGTILPVDEFKTDISKEAITAMVIEEM